MDAQGNIESYAEAKAILELGLPSYKIGTKLGEPWWLHEKLWKQARNTCQQCGRHDRLVRRNYDMMWGDADLYCSHCNIKIRDMDFG